MTQFTDQFRVGAGYYEAATRWNATTPMNGLPIASSPQDTQVAGVPLTQLFVYQIGVASTAGTATAGRFFYSASGATGGFTAATMNTYTNDVPRGLRVYSSVNLSTVTFTFIGTDGYGKTINHAFVGPTGNTLGNVGSYTDSLVAFKSLTSASGNGSTGTTAFAISNNDTYGLPYVLSNLGMGCGGYINGSFATVPGAFTAAYTPTGTPTASTTDVRGLYTFATAVIANDSRYFTVQFIAPPVNLTPSTDDKVHSFGATPFAG